MPVVTDYTALLGGNYWGGIETAERPAIVTYSFPAAAPDYNAGIAGFTAATIASFQAFTPAEQAQARAALADWAAASGIVFVEVAAGQGDINFQIVDLNTAPAYSGAGGIAFEPFGAWDSFSYPYFSGDLDAAGDVFMNSQFIAGGLVDPGTLRHEIGHALGLKHPTEVRVNYAADVPVTHDQVLAADDPALTIMATAGGTPALKQLDLDAAAFIYGASGGSVVTADASGSNSIVASWSWNAAAQTLTQAGFDDALGIDAIRGSSVTDVIDGLAGDDRLFGLAGADILAGGAGMDQLFGGGGADSMAGGANEDSYFVDDTADAVQELADEGYDSVYATASFVLPEHVEYLQLFGGGPGGLGLTGTGNGLANSIFGEFNFSNVMNGGGGGDYIVGGSQADTIDGGAGDDTIDGAGGTDTAGYASAASGVTVSLLIAGAQNTVGAGLDTLSMIENLTGSAHADTLRGSEEANAIVGGGGNDIVYANGGDDTVDGGGGADNMRGNQGDDVYFVDDNGDNTTELPGEGVDEVRSSRAVHYLSADIEKLTGLVSSGQQLVGNILDNAIVCGAGNDLPFGGGGADTIGGGAGADTMRGEAGNDALNGDTGNDVAYGGADNDVIDGGAGADSMRGDGGDDIFYIDDPGDAAVEFQNEGNDEVRTANAVLFLSAWIEKLTGLSAAGQRLAGNASANVIAGASGNDVITGADGADSISAGGGNDSIYGDTAGDTLNGEEGIDYVNGGAGDDVMNGGGGADSYLFGGDGADTVAGGDGGDRIEGGGGDDVLNGEADADYVTGGLGDDTINGGGEDDVFLGGAAGADSIGGGTGNDRIDGASEADTLNGGDGVDYVTAGSGNDTIDGGAGADNIYGEANNDVIEGGGDNDAWLGGGAGDDSISGGSGADRIHGGADNDLITGGDGADVSNGGAGDDIFVYAFASEGSASEQIGDWKDGLDTLRIDASNFGGGLGPGALAADRLVASAAPAATQAFGQFLYNTSTGFLAWDADGTGAGAATTLVKLFTGNFTAIAATPVVGDFDIVA